MNEQQQNLSRVSNQIASIITTFLEARLNQEFYCDELRRFVSERVTVAPGSPDRVLRDLRKRGVISYEVVSRSRSLYRALPVKGQGVLFS